jgi:predicted MPP superfamily phosphohydrolase
VGTGERWLTRRRFLAAAGGAVAAGAAYACGIEPEWLRVARLTFRVPGLDPAFDGYTIPQISDLHVGAAVRRAFLDEAVGVATDARCDLAVVTGDLVDESGLGGAAEEAAAVLRGLRARDGVLACLGNHDTGAYHAGRPVNAGALRRLLRALEGAGVDTLENESRAMVRSGARLSVGGYGDLWSGRFAPDALPAPDLALSHNPDTAPRLAASGAKVILSGHTHGGQVRVPLLGAPYVPVRHKEFLAGPYRIGDTHLHVNPGLGYSYRVRFCARPEVTLLTLAAC